MKLSVSAIYVMLFFPHICQLSKWRGGGAPELKPHTFSVLLDPDNDRRFCNNDALPPHGTGLHTPTDGT